MAQSLTGQIAQAAGLPASVRIGTVVQANPLIVSVQGVLYSQEAVGVVEPGVPLVGDAVALLGQSALSGGDPTSWLVLGRIRPSTDAA
jgi:hypothetical protein